MILVQRNYFILHGFVRALNMLGKRGSVSSYQTNHQQFGTISTQGYKIHSCGREYSEYERLSKLNLLPLKYRREINDLVFFFKCLKNIKLNIFDYVSFRSCHQTA